jgi:hypothetical protein
VECSTDWVAVANLVCNTVQVVGLALVSALIGTRVHQNRQEA